MKNLNKVCAALITCMLATGASSDTSYICSHSDSIREIHVIYEVEGQSVPCSVLYRKAEGEQTLWSAEAQEGYCEEKAEAFVDKQRGWGWECAQQAIAGVADEIAEPAGQAVAEESVEEATETP